MTAADSAFRAPSSGAGCTPSASGFLTLARLGGRLIEAVQNLAREEDKWGLSSTRWSSQARLSYEKLGFVRVSTTATQPLALKPRGR
jgi:hypothetical protein